MWLKKVKKKESVGTEYGSTKSSLTKHRTGSNETTFASKIPNIINDENGVIVPWQGKNPVSILSDECCEEQAFPYLIPKGKFDYKAPRDVSIRPTRYFNQRLLNFNQYFASDADYIFLYIKYAHISNLHISISVYEQHHLR